MKLWWFIHVYPLSSGPVRGGPASSSRRWNSLVRHIFILDNLQLARRGLRALIAETQIAATITEVGTLAELAQAASILPQSITLISHRPPDLDAVQALRLIRKDAINTRVILLCDGLYTHNLRELLRHHVDGLIHIDLNSADLASCLDAIDRGEQWICHKMITDKSNLAQDDTETENTDLLVLTPRQREIAILVAQGLSNKQIAYALGITEGTVKFQMHRIFRRTGHANRVALASVIQRPQ